MPVLVAKFLPVLMLLGVLGVAIYFFGSAASEINAEYGTPRAYFESLSPTEKIHSALVLILVVIVLGNFLFS